MVLKYISKKEALILVVVAGNSEIATTKALRLAKTADPEGRRTIGKYRRTIGKYTLGVVLVGG